MLKEFWGQSMEIAIVRGKYLNQYEMQSFEPLAKKHHLVGFSSLRPFHDKFSFPVVKLPSPMDIPDFPFKMPILNRLFIDGQFLFGLEEKLRGFDICHSAETYFGYTQQCLNAKKRGYVKKVVTTIWENTPFANEGIWGRKKFKERARREVDHFICVSKMAKEALLLEGCREGKITVIPPGVDVKRFKPGPKNPWPKTRKVRVLFVGRLEFEKGACDFLFAAKGLVEDKDLENYNLIFTMVGQGSLKRRLLVLEKRLGIKDKIIHKIVPYQEMPREYRGADIFVAPSKPSQTWREQFSMVLLEAQASGLPIVTTYCGAIPENVGKAALVVSPGEAVEIKEAIKKLILNPNLAKEIGLAAQKRAVGFFDAEEQARKIEKVYHSLL